MSVDLVHHECLFVETGKVLSQSARQCFGSSGSSLQEVSADLRSSSLEQWTMKDHAGSGSASIRDVVNNGLVNVVHRLLVRSLLGAVMPYSERHTPQLRHATMASRDLLGQFTASWQTPLLVRILHDYHWCLPPAPDACHRQIPSTASHPPSAQCPPPQPQPHSSLST